MKLAHDLGNGCAFGIFKPGIRPVWEDPANIRGGKWAIHLDVAQRDMDLHETWLNTVRTFMIIIALLHTEYSGAHGIVP